MVVYTVVDVSGTFVQAVGSYKEAREMLAKEDGGEVIRHEFPCTKEGMLQIANHFVLFEPH